MTDHVTVTLTRLEADRLLVAASNQGFVGIQAWNSHWKMYEIQAVERALKKLGKAIE
jgi:hypothetical protein